MIISINQPAYLPWLGYFHRIAVSDIFVFFDFTQFEKNSMVNRNKIKTANGSLMLTVPANLGNHFNKKIKEINIADKNWAEKHWKSIEINYKKSKYWDKYAPDLKRIYGGKDYQTIDQICYDQLLFFIGALDIKTKIIKSSDLPEFKSKKQELVLDILKELRADIYVSGALGRDYIDEQKFNDENIKLYYQDYRHPEYEQLWGKFLPYMSVIDLLFNCGEKSLDIIMEGNINKQNLLKI